MFGALSGAINAGQPYLGGNLNNPYGQYGGINPQPAPTPGFQAPPPQTAPWQGGFGVKRPMPPGQVGNKNSNSQRWQRGGGIDPNMYMLNNSIQGMQPQSVPTTGLQAGPDQWANQWQMPGQTFQDFLGTMSPGVNARAMNAFRRGGMQGVSSLSHGQAWQQAYQNWLQNQGRPGKRMGQQPGGPPGQGGMMPWQGADPRPQGPQSGHKPQQQGGGRWRNTPPGPGQWRPNGPQQAPPPMSLQPIGDEWMQDTQPQPFQPVATYSTARSTPPAPIPSSAAPYMFPTG